MRLLSTQLWGKEDIIGEKGGGKRGEGVGDLTRTMTSGAFIK